MTNGSTLTIILGSPASGKTTLARRLAADLGVACLCKDDVKEALFEQLGTGDRAWSRRLSEASFAALARLAATQLAVGTSCIVEGNLRPAHGAVWAGLLEAHRAAVRQVWCHCTPALIRERFAARRRHPGHLDAGQLAGELEASAAQPPTFLEIPGGRWIHEDQPLAYERLVAQLRLWTSVQ